MRIEKTGYVPGVTETYLAYIRTIARPRSEAVERQEPAEYKVNPIKETPETARYDARGNSKGDASLGRMVNKLA